MANGIDPLTGLPSDLFDSVVNQIPLGTGVFPWEDLEATSRPVRPPLYGDDILPTHALVGGQHPTTHNAQTVNTDGNHRLLVSTGQSGGGLAPVVLFDRRNRWLDPTGNPFQGLGFFVHPILYRLQVFYNGRIESGVFPAGDAIEVSLSNDSTLDEFRIFNGAQIGGSDINNGMCFYHMDQWFERGIDLGTMLEFSGLTDLTVNVYNADNDSYLSVLAWTADS